MPAVTQGRSLSPSPPVGIYPLCPEGCGQGSRISSQAWGTPGSELKKSRREESEMSAQPSPPLWETWIPLLVRGPRVLLPSHGHRCATVSWGCVGSVLCPASPQPASSAGNPGWETGKGAGIHTSRCSFPRRSGRELPAPLPVNPSVGAEAGTGGGESGIWGKNSVLGIFLPAAAPRMATERHCAPRSAG